MVKWLLTLVAAQFFTLALAECVGTEGRVYTVDLDKKAIQALEKKVDKLGHRNIAISHATLKKVTIAYHHRLFCIMLCSHFHTILRIVFSYFFSCYPCRAFYEIVNSKFIINNKIFP